MPKNFKLFKDDKGLNKCRDKSYQWEKIISMDKNTQYFKDVHSTY